MENTFLIAQVIGVLGVLISTMSWQLKKSRHIIFYNGLSCLFWAIHFFLLSAPIGVVMNITSMCRDSLLTFIHKRYIKEVVFLFLTVFWSFGLYHYSHWFDLLPLIAGTIINLSLLQRDNRELIARCIILGQILWAIYCILISSYMGLTCCVIIIISSIIGMARHECWQLSTCYKSFGPSLIRSLFTFPSWRTYP